MTIIHFFSFSKLWLCITAYILWRVISKKWTKLQVFYLEHTLSDICLLKFQIQNQIIWGLFFNFENKKFSKSHAVCDRHKPSSIYLRFLLMHALVSKPVDRNILTGLWRFLEHSGFFQMHARLILSDYYFFLITRMYELSNFWYLDLWNCNLFN